MTTPLSPAARAVRNAYHEICEDYIETWLNFNHNRGLAAALRAAADQVVPLTPKPNDTFCCPPVDTILWMRVTDIRSQLLAIADELEGQGG